MGLRHSRDAGVPATLLYEKQLHQFETHIVALEERLVLLRLREPATLRSISLAVYSLAVLVAAILYLFLPDAASHAGPVDPRSKNHPGDYYDGDAGYSNPPNPSPVAAEQPHHQAGASTRILATLAQSETAHSAACAALILLPFICAHAINLALRTLAQRYFRRQRRLSEEEIDQVRIDARGKADELRRITEFERARDVLARLENVATPGYSERMYAMARQSAESIAQASGQSPLSGGTPPAPGPVSLWAAAAGRLLGSLMDRMVVPEHGGQAAEQNMYALVCCACHQHNGLVLPSQIERMIFVCRFCETLNGNCTDVATATVTTPVKSVPVPDADADADAEAEDDAETNPDKRDHRAVRPSPNGTGSMRPRPLVPLSGDDAATSKKNHTKGGCVPPPCSLPLVPAGCSKSLANTSAENSDGPSARRSPTGRNTVAVAGPAISPMKTTTGRPLSSSPSSPLPSLPSSVVNTKSAIGSSTSPETRLARGIGLRHRPFSAID